MTLIRRGLCFAVGALVLAACGSAAPTTSQIKNNAIQAVNKPAIAHRPFEVEGSSLQPFLLPVTRSLVSKGTYYVVRLSPEAGSKYLPVAAVENHTGKVLFLLPITSDLQSLTPTQYSGYNFPPAQVALLKQLISDPKYNKTGQNLIGLRFRAVKTSSLPQGMRTHLTESQYTGLALLSVPSQPVSSTTFARLRVTTILLDQNGKPVEVITRNF